ncbi:hypothetical protein EMCRGX_G001510 [Ephydatia muelleri]
MDALEENFVATFPKDAKRTRSVVIQQELGERIMSLLKNPLNTSCGFSGLQFQGLLDASETSLPTSLLSAFKKAVVSKLASGRALLEIAEYLAVATVIALKQPVGNEIRPTAVDTLTGVMECIQKLWHPMGILCSATGVQQDDLLVLHQLILKIAGDHLTKDLLFNIKWDDGTLAGTSCSVKLALDFISSVGPSLGFHTNFANEVFG